MPKQTKYFVTVALLLILASIIYSFFNTDEIKNKIAKITEFVPVCGIDGVTYFNSYVAESYGTDVAYNGKCDTLVSQKCTNEGGEFVIKTKENGEFGVCVFENNNECEGVALLNGDCPSGGINIADYENEKQIYCTITGGQVNENACIFKVCDLDEYYNGDCIK